MKKAMVLLMALFLAMGCFGTAPAESDTAVIGDRAEGAGITVPLSDYYIGHWEPLTEDRTELNTDYASQNDLVVGQHTAKVYLGRLDRYWTLEVAEVKGYEDVPFVSVRGYLEALFNHDVTFRMVNGHLLICHQGAVAELIPELPELRCDNWYAFFRSSDTDTVNSDFAEPRYTEAIRVSDLHAATVTTPAFSPISMAYDGNCAVALERDVLLPFGVLQSVFALSYPDNNKQFRYNGDDFFLVTDRPGDVTIDETPAYETAMRSGRFWKMGKASPAYAGYNYACICLTMDRYFGHKEELGIESFDSYAESVGLKEGLNSRDPEVNLNALLRLVLRLDSAHERVAGAHTLFTEDNINIDPSMDEYVGENRARLADNHDHMYDLRPEEYRNGPLIAFEDDTAFIYFENFVRNDKRPYSYYVRVPHPEDNNLDNFALMYDAFRQIRERPEIRNVVIDLSANGGGESTAIIAVLGFLSPDGEVKITRMNRMTDALTTEYYRVDTNLDGVFDEKDGYGGEYDFYIVNSGFTYSAGTGLSFCAMVNGLATIMGEPAGGGDCCVLEYYDAYGFGLNFSDYLPMGTLADGVFVSSEKAVVPAIPFGDKADEIYFNRPAMVELIHRYSR